MKLVLILFTLLLAQCILKAQNTYTIEGNISNFPDTVGYSFAVFENNFRQISPDDCDTVFNGKFTISKSVEGTKLMILDCFLNNKPAGAQKCNIWVRPGAHIKVTGTDLCLSNWEVESDIPEQKEFNLYKNKNKKEFAQLLALQLESEKLVVKIKAGDQKSRIKVDSLAKIQKAIISAINQNNLSVMQENPIGPIGLDELKKIASSFHYNNSGNKELIKQVFNLLSEEQKQSDTGKEIYAYIHATSVVNIGDPMADADLYDPEGNVHHLSDYKGKYILLDFWGYSCGPCIAALPELKSVSTDYKDQITVVSLYTDHKNRWQETFKNKSITWLNLSDNLGMSGIALKYGVRGIPHFVLISPDGIIQDAWTGYIEGKIIEKLNNVIQNK